MDAVPDTVHHAAYVLDLDRDLPMLCSAAAATHKPITDDVHHPRPKTGHGSGAASAEARSQMVKELKQLVLLQIIDKFQVTYQMTELRVYPNPNRDFIQFRCRNV